MIYNNKKNFAFQISSENFHFCLQFRSINKISTLTQVPIYKIRLFCENIFIKTQNSR